MKGRGELPGNPHCRQDVSEGKVWRGEICATPRVVFRVPCDDYRWDCFETHAKGNVRTIREPNLPTHILLISQRP